MIMGALLAEATERMEREAFFTKARAQLSRLQQDDPSAWKADHAETASWQKGTNRDTLSNQDEPGWWE
jgi:hypothetical protein